MRKKYLSALLFGALLVTSAGTFTSCKDYDDEINDLQEQINTIKTTLSELEKQIGDKGVSSVTFNEETGVLTVVDGEGSHSYEIKTDAEAKIDAVIKDDILTINGKEIGKVGGDEVVVEDGKLKVNGDVVYEFGPKVVLVKNLDNGTCTLTVGNETVTLPLAIASVDFKVTLNTTNDYVVFTNSSKNANSNVLTGGIFWANSSKNVEWKGPKGNITEGQFLVGQINTASVNVAPATFDLGAIKLELVNTAGEVAPVIVKATPANSEDAETAGTSRAADKKGAWNLSIEMKDEVNENNIATAFATGKGDNDRNYKYALKANGTVVSDYSFVIDTDVTATTSKADAPNIDNHYFINGTKYSSGSIDYKLGDLKFEYHGDKIYDYYITFAGKDINDAEFKGVTIKDNVITASEKAAGETIEFEVHAIDVLGNEQISDADDNFKIKFEGSTTDPIELTTTNHVASPTFAEDGLVIDLGTTFSGLTAEEATLVNKVKWTTKDSKFIFDTDSEDKLYGVTIEYFKDAECKQPVTGIGADGTWDAQTNIREIKYAKLTGAYNTTAEVGTYNATLTLFKTNNSVDSELKKVTVPVKVTLPAFDELFEKSGSWGESGNDLTLKLSNAGTWANTDLTGTLTSKDFTKVLSKFSVEFDDVEDKDINSAIVLTTGGNLQISNVADKKALIMKDGKYLPLKGAVSYNLGAEKLVVTSDKFTLNLVSEIDGAEVKYYNDGTPGACPITAASGIIAAYVSEGDPKKDKNLAVVLNDKKKTIAEIDALLTTSNTTITAKFDSKAGASANAEVNESTGEITYSNVNPGTYKTVLTLTITESKTGIVTELPIEVSVKF